MLKINKPHLCLNMFVVKNILRSLGCISSVLKNNDIFANSTYILVFGYWMYTVIKYIEY